MFLISNKFSAILFFLSIIFFLNNISYAQEFKCLDCHDNVIQKSVHNEAISCQDCHQNIIDESHIEKKSYKKVKCESCHEEYRELVDSDIHHRLKGKVKNPPDCKRCHGSHEVKPPPKENKLKVKEYCSKCHTSIVLANPYHTKAVEGAKCLQCHKESDHSLEITKSVHKGLECADCHNFISNNLTNHPKNLKNTQKADCYICHSRIAKDHRESIHGISLDIGVDEAAMCWDCHGSHVILKTKDPNSKVYPQNLAATCGNCHDDPKLTKKYNIGIRTPGKNYSLSVHGVLVQSGRMDAANCSLCHGVHDIKNIVQPGSKISPFQIPETCGECHKEIAEEYQKSVHWIYAKKGYRESPVCNDCHNEHNVLAISTVNKRDEMRKIQQRTCMVCHQDPRIQERFGKDANQARQYQDSYHGLAIMRGDKDAALCVDCHNVHKILPQDHPESSVNQANVTATCKKCHADATDIFSKSYSHKTENETASKIEDIVATIYFWLIVSVIGAMIMHNLLIFFYEIRKKHNHLLKEITIPRFTNSEVVQHYLLLISFITLAITGFALKYTTSWWAEMLLSLGMTEPLRQNIHRVAAVVMILTGLYHMGYLFFSARGRDVLYNLLPRLSDLTDARDNILYYLRIKKEKPKFDKYDYTEKAEYWALIWGTIVMGVTGFVLWFPTIVGDWAPVWLIKVSELIHFYEAILATLAIVVWHWFFVIFHPHEYPMSLTWVDGRMSLQTYRHHHEKHFRKLILQWKELKAGKRDTKSLSNSTILFASTLEKNGLNPDQVFQHEIDNDPELRNWLEEKLNPLEIEGKK